MKNKQLTLGSLFDGSGGFPLGGLMCGIKPLWASEIEPFPIRVTTKRLPFMKHLGDINKINGADIDPVDIVTFGSPCTDMSIAGKRAGLDGKQSALFYQAIRVIKEMRCKTNGEYPRWALWENVPGAFSSNKGEDFRTVLEGICKIKKQNLSVPRPSKWSNAGEIVGDNFSLAWRVLDAQCWGVPQRIRRIYLVADFGSRCAGKILFESEGMSGYSAQSLRAWQRTTGNFTYNTGETGGLCLNDEGGNRMDVTENMTCTLRAQAHHPPCVLETVVIENNPSDSRVTVSNTNKVQTLMSRMGDRVERTLWAIKRNGGTVSKGAAAAKANDATIAHCGTKCGGNNVPLVMSKMPKTYGICSKDSNSMKSNNPHSGIYEAETARTLDGNGGNPSCNQGGIAIVAFTQNQRDEVRVLGNKSGALNAASSTKQQTFVLQDSMIGHKDENDPQGNGINEDVSFTLNTTDRHAVYAMTTDSYMQTLENQSPTLTARDFKAPNTIAYGIGRDAFNQGKNAKWNPCFSENLQPTLVAKGPGAIQSGYVVRRLTPKECARLQGFPDRWCEDLGTEDPTDEEIKKWQRIFDDYNKAIGKTTKSKTENQIRKWLKNPHSDSAEYKMWGNGVALPCVYFVLSGIVYCSQLTGE